MGINEIIAFFDFSVSYCSGYYNNNNSLEDNTFTKKYKFNRIIENMTLNQEYKLELIKHLQYNSVFVPTDKITNSFVLFGNTFDYTYGFTNLINQLIDEFILETFPFSINIINITNDGVFDLINYKKINFEEEFTNNFISTKINLDPLDSTFINKIFNLTDKLTKNYNSRIMGSHVIIMFENIYQKTTIYNLEDLNINSSKLTDINAAYISLQISKINNLLLFNNTIKDNSPLIKMLDSEFKNNSIVKVLFRFCNNLRLLNLSASFYDFIENKKKATQLVLYKTIDPIKNYNTDNNKLNAKFDINKITSHFNHIKPIPNEKLNKTSTGLVKYFPKTPINSPKTELKTENITKKPPLLIKEYDEKNKPMEIIKYVSMFKQDQSNIFDKLKILNKFLFDGSVKNQIKLQIGHKDNSKISEVNKDLIINMKSLLSVVLDQLNQI